MSDTLVGRTIDRYKITRAIREGGVGAVYLAEDTSLARPVALKFLKAAQAEDQDLVLRLHQEAKTMARLENAHIVSVYDFVASDEHVYVAMQFVDGESLQDRLKRKGRLPLSEVLRVIRDCARGLAAAHEQSILHRDMKPSNVILTRRGEVKVADFGLAQPVDESQGAEKTGKVDGTPHYMSPEQCRGAAQDARSDIYSLGVMFYQLLTGDVPYNGRTIRVVLTSHVKDPVPAADEKYPDLGIPKGVGELISSMMAKAPEDRPDAAAVERSITSLAQGKSPDGSGPQAPQRSRQAGPGLSRRLVSVSVVIVIAGAAIWGALWFQEQQHRQREDDAWARVANFGLDEPAVREVALKGFVRQWPESRYAVEAQRQLGELASREDPDPSPVAEESIPREDVDRARERAEFELELARKERAPEIAKDSFDRAMALFDEAEDLEDRRDLPAALDRYEEARRSFIGVHETTRERVAERAAVQEELRQYQLLRQEAQRLSIPQLAADIWKKCEESFREASSAAASGETFVAERALQFATRDLTAAISTHRAVGLEKNAAEQLLAELETVRQRAVSAGAETSAAKTLAAGDGKLEEGRSRLSEGAYAEAVASLKAARKSYEEARRAADVASALDEPDPEKTNGGGNPAPGKPVPPDSGEKPQVNPVPTSGLARLFSVEPRLDKGILSLNYPQSSDFQNDIQILKNPENVHFEEWRFPLGTSRFTFGGEKSGFLLLNASFEDLVEVELKAHFYYVLPGQTFFRVIVMAEDGKSFYASDFGSNIQSFSRGRRKTMTKARQSSQRQHPTKWVQKGRDLKIAMSYEKKGKDKGIISVTHRFAESAVRKSDLFRKGKIGFWWNNCVFVVKDLEVRGKVDEEWLESRLRETQ